MTEKYLIHKLHYICSCGNTHVELFNKPTNELIIYDCRYAIHTKAKICDKCSLPFKSMQPEYIKNKDYISQEDIYKKALKDIAFFEKGNCLDMDIICYNMRLIARKALGID